MRDRKLECNPKNSKFGHGVAKSEKHGGIKKQVGFNCKQGKYRRQGEKCAKWKQGFNFMSMNTVEGMRTYLRRRRKIDIKIQTNK